MTLADLGGMIRSRVMSTRGCLRCAEIGFLREMMLKRTKDAKFNRRTTGYLTKGHEALARTREKEKGGLERFAGSRPKPLRSKSRKTCHTDVLRKARHRYNRKWSLLPSARI